MFVANQISVDIDYVISYSVQKLWTWRNNFCDRGH